MGPDNPIDGSAVELINGIAPESGYEDAERVQEEAEWGKEKGDKIWRISDKVLLNRRFPYWSSTGWMYFLCW